MPTPENTELDPKGTREPLTDRYGPSLLCVRYRYEYDTRECLKTLESVVQRRSREREAEYPGSRKLDGRVGSAARRRVTLRVGFRKMDQPAAANPPEVGGTRSGGLATRVRTY